MKIYRFFCVFFIGLFLVSCSSLGESHGTEENSYSVYYLDNGIPVYFHENPVNRVFYLSTVFKKGVLPEDSEASGMAPLGDMEAVTLSLMQKETDFHSENEIIKFFSDTSSGCYSGSNQDYSFISFSSIDKYFENSSAEVTIRAEKNEQIAEVVVSANGERFAAASEEKDLYASIDKVIDILEGQIRKYKTKKEKMMKESSLKGMEVQSPRIEIKNEILKYGYYEIKPLAPEDAMLELQDRPTHNFLPFINLETNKVCVIYKLKDGKNYGIVEPEA